MSVIFTDKLNLSLPEKSENYSVNLYNDNFKKIDSAFKEVTDEVLAEVNKKLENFDDTKRSIVSSPLGQALSLTYDENDPTKTTTWEDMTNALVRVPNYGEYNYNGTDSVALPEGYYKGGIIDCSAAYNKGKQDALKVAGGLQMYPAANGVTWTGSASASAYNPGSTSSASASCITKNMVDLTNVSTITAIFSGDINPKSTGSGGTVWGSGSASLVVTRGSGNAAYGKVDFSTGGSTKAIVVDVKNLTGNYLVQANLYAYGGSITNTAGRTWGAGSTVTMTSCNAGS